MKHTLILASLFLSAHFMIRPLYGFEVKNFNILSATMAEITGVPHPPEFPYPIPPNDPHDPGYPTPTPPERPNPAPYPEPKPPSPQHIGLYVQNNCYQDIALLIKYQGLDTTWYSKGFFQIPQGRVVHVANMRQEFYYLFAFTEDRTRVWRGPHEIELNNINYPATIVFLPKHFKGNWTTVLYCY